VLLNNHDLPGNISGQSDMPIPFDYANYYHTISTTVDPSYSHFRENDYDDQNQQIIFHELGHAVGMKHPWDKEKGGLEIESNQSTLFTTMAYSDLFYGPNVERIFPNGYMAADMLAVQKMYGANFSTRHGDDVYRFESLQGKESYHITVDGKTLYHDGLPILSIWDGGGTDTYDYSGVDHGVEIDLRPGAYSSILKGPISGPKGDVRLGTIQNSYLYDGDTRSLVENAVGTRFDDTLIGNGAGNRLVGGKGDDTLIGGKGDDVFVFAGGKGHDTVRDFHDGDMVDLRKADSIGSVSDLFAHHMSASAEGLLIEIDANDTVLLAGIHRKDVDGADFLV
jgi:serralysin